MIHRWKQKKSNCLLNETKIVTFSITEANEGGFNVTVGDLAGLFSVSAKPAQIPTALHVANMFINPLEAWSDQPVNITVDVSNTGTESISYQLPFVVDGQNAQSVQVDLAGGAKQKITATIIESALGYHYVNVGGQANTISIVPTGKHTIHILCNHAVPFTLNGASHVAPYSELVDVGSYTVTISASVDLIYGGYGYVNFQFQSWNDGTINPTRTVNVQAETYLSATYTHRGSCPALYVWNGTGYGYVADVSDGSGWLGYLEYFNPDHTAVYSYNYPYDYIKMDSTQIQPINGLYNLKITEMADEIFYLDSAKIIAVDHPTDTNVYSTTATFLYNLTGQGTIYTVSSNPATPVSAVNGKGQNVLPQISKLDGNYTTGTMWGWNNITLNLGNLASASDIKLVVAAKITWPTTQAGGNNFLKYQNQPGVMPSPPPYMEVKAANGSWVRVPDNRQFPLPDVSDNVFVVNLTGLFPTNDYELRINTYQNIQFDYIGVDTTPQQDIVVHTILPSSANLQPRIQHRFKLQWGIHKIRRRNSVACNPLTTNSLLDEKETPLPCSFQQTCSPVPKVWCEIIL